MHVVANSKLLQRESRIGGVLLGVTFGLLLLGLVLSMTAEQWVPLLEPMLPNSSSWLPLGITYAIVLVGMGLYYVGNARVRRYGPQHRQDERLTRVLKGLDDRYTLYTYLGRKLPDYVLIGPSGVYVITARVQRGEIVCRDDRWSVSSGAAKRFFTALYGSPIGSPSWDTDQGVKQLQGLLHERLPSEAAGIPVSGLIVFTGEGVKLRVGRCSFTATTAKDLRRVVTKLKGRLTSGQLTRLRSAVGGSPAA